MIYKNLFKVHLSYVLVLLLFAGVYAVLGLFDNLEKNFMLLHTNNMVMGSVLTILVLLFFQKHIKKHVRDMGWKFNLLDATFLFVILIVTAIIAGLFIITLQSNGRLHFEVRIERFREMNYYFLIFWALLGWFIAALKEEVLSRGYVLFSIQKLNFGMMLFVSAVLFMLLHIPTGGFDLIRMGSWFMGGLVYAFIYLKSGSISVVTVVHMIHNFINDWVLGQYHEFTIVELSQKVQSEDKLLYEIVLKLAFFLIALLFYGRNGVTTPAENLRTLWNKRRNNPSSHFELYDSQK